MAGGRTAKASTSAAARAAKEAERVGHLLDKTKLCKFFFEGKCQRGRSCTFAHSESELHVQPDLYRSQLCMEFAQTGKCRYGAACRFAHGQEQLRQVAGVADRPADAEASGDDLKRQLAEMRHRTRALEAQLEAMGGAAAPATDAWHYDCAWAAWQRPASFSSVEAGYVDMGMCQGWDETACAWTPYDGAVGLGDMYLPTSPVQAVAVMMPTAPWQPSVDCGANSPTTDCDASSQPSTDCEGGGPSHSTDSDVEDAASAARVVVRNTFIEFELTGAEGTARHRARSAPGGRSP